MRGNNKLQVTGGAAWWWMAANQADGVYSVTDDVNGVKVILAKVVPLHSTDHEPRTSLFFTHRLYRTVRRVSNQSIIAFLFGQSFCL